MIRLIAILLLLALVASIFATPAAYSYQPAASTGLQPLPPTAESRPLVSTAKELAFGPQENNQGASAAAGGGDTITLFGHNIPKSDIKTDFGSLSLGGMQYNGNNNLGRTLVLGRGGNSRALDNAYLVNFGGNPVQGPFLGVAYSKNPLSTGGLNGAIGSSGSDGGFTFLPDMPLAYDSINSSYFDNNNNNTPLLSGRLSGASIIGADKAGSLYNATGDKATVAIVDTGTDFSNPDIRNALARDKNGVPMMLDADGQGLVLTRAKYAANIDQRTGVIMNLTDSGTSTSGRSTTTAPTNTTGYGNVKLPENMTSYVYVNGTGVYLRTTQGRIPVYNSLYPTFGTPVLSAVANVDWKIGKSPTNYIRSMSGVYHFGVAYQATTKLGTISLTLIPVLVVDSTKPGVYDTIIADMSYAWYYFTLGIAGSFPQTAHLIPPSPSFDFTTEKQFKLGDGNEFLTYDYNHDGVPDYSAGAIGARVLDIWRVVDNRTQVVSADKANVAGAISAKLLEPMDPNGNYFGLMYDFEGHGTSTAAVVASRGHSQYDIYHNSTRYTLAGMAPNAKIIPVKSLWIGDALYGWLWASGFDLGSDGRWNYTGNHKADIMSNSWGVSSFPLLKYGLGYDILSVFSSLLMVPHLLAKDYPGTVVVDSIGNNGLGYGSVGSPNTSPLAISVGATTNNVHIQYGPFANITRLGSSTASYDDVAEFSSRGPSLLGDPKPELMAIGSYGFTPTDVTIKNLGSKKDDPNNNGAFALFGGTSMAAPMVAGAAALVVQEIKEAGNKTVDPFEVKSILMSTAKDLKNDPFVQGSGRVDALAAVKLARGEAGKFSLYTNDTSKNIIQALKPAVKTYSSVLGVINTGYANQTTGSLLYPAGENFQPESRWFAGQIEPGKTASTDIVVYNPSKQELKVKLYSATEKLVARYQINNSTKLFQVDPTHSDKKFGYAPNYYNLTKLIGGKIPNSDLMVAKVNFPFSSFMNSTDLFANSLRIASLYGYDWHDLNKDGKINYNEIEFLNRGGSWGTTQEMRIGDPTHRFSGTPLLGIYPVPSIFSFWSGDRLINSTSMNYTLTVEFYKRMPNPNIQLEKGIVTVPPGGRVNVHATVSTGSSSNNNSNDTSANSQQLLLSGVYYGEIIAETSRASSNLNAKESSVGSSLSSSTGEATTTSVVMPVSYVVTTKPVPKDVPVVESPPIPTTTATTTIPSSLHQEQNKIDEKSLGLKPNGYVGGLSDMVSRYAAGDWRSYYFNVTDPTITTMTLRVSWPHNDTSVNAMAYGPDGRLVASSVPAGVFQEFADWPSNDWLGTSTVSEGGAFFFSQNAGEHSTVLNVPINGTGVYSLLVHNTLFYGGSLYEPLFVEAKFSTIISDTTPPKITAVVPKLVNGGNPVVIPITIDDSSPTEMSYFIDGRLQPHSADNQVVIDGGTLSEGPHHLVVESKDAAGNSSSSSWEFTVDRTPPFEQLFVSRNSGSSGGGAIAADNDNNGTSSAVNYGVLKNNGGGIDENNNSIKIQDSGSSPLPSSSPTVVVAVSKQVTFRWNVTDPSGIRGKVTVILPGAKPASYEPLSSAVFDSTKLDDGRYKITILSRDGAGNKATRSWDLLIDNTAPKVSLNVPAGKISGMARIGLGVESKYLKSAVLSIGDDRMQMNVTGLEAYDIDTTSLPDGHYDVKLAALDAAGNTGTANAMLTVANTAPIVEMVAALGVAGGLAGGVAVTWIVGSRRWKDREPRG